MIPPAMRADLLQLAKTPGAPETRVGEGELLPVENKNVNLPIDSSAAGGGEGPANEVEAAIMLAQGWETFPQAGMQLKKTLQEIEKNYIEQALKNSSGNVSKTARLLNIQRTTLIEKINRYGISSEI